ncbi:MAG: CRR6 family NdhI maturation factor [Cyanobacteria bacterium P01_D01_bin.116]
MNLTITIPSSSINRLDLSPAITAIDKILAENKITSSEQQLRLDIQYELESGDPRELSEVPEVRLWFIRLDAKYPWLPFLLDWQSGEFVRYAAMLVPHQFSSKEGIQYNPEALEIFLMQKTFFLKDWLEKQNIPSQSRIKSMAKLLGYDLDDELFAML